MLFTEITKVTPVKQEGIIFICADTWISQVVPTARRGRAIGIYGTLLAVGVATGPLLLELTGVEGAVPFPVFQEIIESMLSYN